MKKYHTDRTRGSGGCYADYVLSDDAKKLIIKLFKKKAIENEKSFFDEIEFGINSYLMLSSGEEEFSMGDAFDEIEYLYKSAMNFHHHLSNCNLKSLDYIGMSYYELFKKNSFEDQRILEKMLDDFVKASKDMLDSKKNGRGSIHATIHQVTRAIIHSLKAYTDYAINDKESGKLVQILELIIPEIGYEGRAVSIAKNFLRRHPEKKS